jgi:hypothetical protein
MSANRRLRNAIVAGLRAELGSAVHVYRVPPDQINAPAVIIGGLDWSNNVVDGRAVTVSLYVAVSRRNTDFIDALDDLCDPDDGGVPIAVENDSYWGSVIESARVVSVGNYRDLVIADDNYYAATVTVEVFC